MSTVPIIDLAYELRMLFGAVRICRLFDEFNVGNPVNYPKDSAYLHARNLYNFFAADTRNDAKVTQFTHHQFDLTLYRTWKDALHNHASHIKTSRHTPTNVHDREHLNKQPQKFADDIEKLWVDWIAHTTDPRLKAQLKDGLSAARLEAQDDYDSLKQRLSELS
jgi:hypothetical protein